MVSLTQQVIYTDKVRGYFKLVIEQVERVLLIERVEAW
jgi:hypothetical protein